MTDSTGRTFIDAYNNVPVVGHAHPRVSGAIADQARLLSTNLRYLHPRAIELAERLVATMPAGASTPSCWSTPAARRPTWRGGWRRPPPAAPGALVTDFAYHGVTTATTALSPEEWRGGWTPAHVERFAAPRGPRPDTGVVRRGRRQAAARPGTSRPWSSSTPSTPATASSRPARPTTRPSGSGRARRGRSGRGRRGAGRVRPGRRPPVVVRRRGPGARRGHPRQADGQRLPDRRRRHPQQLRRGARDEAEFFSTFAGSPVAAVAGARRPRRDRGRRPGRARRGDGRCCCAAGCGSATAGCAAVRDVRGRGLLVGVDLAGTPPTLVAAVQDRVTRARRADRHDRPGVRRPEDPAAAADHARPRSSRSPTPWPPP